MEKKETQTFESTTTNPMFPQVKDVSPEEVNKKRTQLHLIDVRRPDEFHGELEHIPESKLITLDNLTDNQNSIPKSGTIIFICRSGNRSAHASAWAQDNGWANTYNMKGGMIAWNDLEFETEA